MKQIQINRKQFKELEKIFNEHSELTHLYWVEDNSNGIGPVITLEFVPTGKVKVDITDIESW